MRQTIKRPIRGYDPEKQRKVIENVVQKKTANLRGTHVVSYTVGLHFTKDGNLVLQRYDQIYEDGKPALYKTYVDLFSPGGELLLSGKEFSDQIISIDNNDNVYACPYPEINQLEVYSLIIKKKAAANASQGD